MVLVGERLWHGEGVVRNVYSAVQWFRKAADAGDVRAQFRLGVCYESGEGVEKDLKVAQQLFWQAAQEQSINTLKQQQIARLGANAARSIAPAQAHRYYQDAGEHWATLPSRNTS